MNEQISIREAVTETDVASFWEQLRIYQKRDIFSDPEDGSLDYFLSEDYYRQIQAVHDRQQNPLYYLFFHRNGQDIGFAMPAIFTTEDGKCFIMEFCVYPQFRGGGTGTRCARALLRWARERGAVYGELNYGSDERRQRFWARLGFVPNGADEWGEPLMLLPPEEALPFTVERLTDPEDWQLMKLENGFLREIGEEPLSEKKQQRLKEAIGGGKITFFLAKRGYRAVGMCSVSPCYSTFSCAETGVFDDFYVEPAFRRQGAARLLVTAARSWAEENALSGLTVGCADCDTEMYRALGFDVRLGIMLTLNL